MKKILLIFGICLFLSGNSWAARTISSATVDGSSSTSVSTGATISAVVNVSTTGNGVNGRWRSTGWRIAGSSGSLTCENHPNHESSSGSFSETFNITAPAVDGVYNLYLVAYRNNGCSQGASSEYILSSAVTVGSGGATCETFRDEFSSQSYSRQDGTVNWETDWVETGDNGAVSNGDIEIDSNRLQLEGDGSGGGHSDFSGDPSIEREANLSAYTTATLTFDYSESGTWEANDDIDIYVSDDGGSNWTLIHRFSNDQGSSTQQFSEDISTYISTNTRIAFVENANSGSEIFYFDNVQIEACGAASVIPTVDSLTTVDTTPILTGTFNSSDSAGGFSVIVDSVTYTLAGSSELTNVGDDWTLDLTSISSLSTGTYEVTATSDDGASTVLSDATSNELVILGPVAEYRLDEITWSGVAGEVIDSSGNGLHGQSVLGTTPLPAQVCNGASLDGSSSYIEVADNALLDIPDELTVTTWIFANTIPGSGLMSILSKDENYEFHINSSGQINWWWGGGSQELTTTGTALTSGNWYHIAIVYSDASDEQTIYIDGVSRGVNNQSGALTLNNDPFQIGADQGFSGREFDGLIDEVRVYNVALSAADITIIMNETRICPDATPLVDHFVIDVGAGSANTCNPFSFTVTAEDSSNNVIPDYAETVSIVTNTSHGNFSTITATNNISPNPDNDDNGSAAYTFDELDTGEITLSLSNEHAETLTISVTDSTVPVTSTSTDITFSDNAFTITDTDALVAGDNVPVAGRDHGYQIQMIRKDPTTGCGVATGYDGVKPLKMWRTKNASDPSSNSPSLDGDTLPSSDPGVVNGSVTFSAGIADVTLATSDIGKFTIELADISNTFAAGTIAGTSSLQIVRPFGIGIDFDNLRDADFSDNGSVDDSNGSDLSYASGIAGSIFTQAGEDFKVTVTGVLWSAADDSDNDGVPDANAYLGNNITAPSFGAEGETITLTASVFEPVGAAVGNFTVNAVPGGEFDTFIAGTQTDALMTYSNVGIIDISANLTDTDYFSSGVNIAGSAPKVGRFNPYQYAVTSSLVNDACVGGGFTYAQQEFTAQVTLEAQNKMNTRTDGFRASYATLSVSSELTIENSETSAVYDLETFTINQDFSTGTMGSIQFDIDLRWDMGLQDKTVTLVNLTGSSDEVTRIAADPVMLGSTEIRYGRLVLDNVFGSELIDLTMPMETEYFDGSNFVVNTSDSCTTINDTDLSVTSLLSAGSSTVSVISTTASSGVLNIGLTAPGAGNTGDIIIRPNLNTSNDPWLRFNWDGVAGTEDPTAKATFGIYSGDSKQIYYRQIYR